MTSYLGGVEGGSISRGDPTAQQTHLVQGGRGVHLVKDRKNSPGQRQKKTHLVKDRKNSPGQTSKAIF